MCCILYNWLSILYISDSAEAYVHHLDDPGYPRPGNPGGSSYRISHGMTAIPIIPPGMPAIPIIPHRMPAIPIPHRMPAIPIPHGMQAIPIPHGMQAIPIPHGIPAIPIIPPSFFNHRLPDRSPCICDAAGRCCGGTGK
jgi:hypothetical protein